LAAAGCGSSEDKSSSTKTATTATTAAGPNGKISVVYDEPTDNLGAQAKAILKLGGTDGVAAGFTSLGEH